MVVLLLGRALGFHLVDALHRHVRERPEHCARAAPGVARRLRKWRKASKTPGRADGAARLWRLSNDSTGATRDACNAALVAEARGAFLGRGRFGGVVALDDTRCAKILRRERSNRDRCVAHAVFSEVAALERIAGGAAARLYDVGLARDCFVVVM